MHKQQLKSVIFQTVVAAEEAKHVQLCSTYVQSHDTQQHKKTHLALSLRMDDSAHNSYDDAHSIYSSNNHQIMNDRSIESGNTISITIFVSHELDRPKEQRKDSTLMI